MNRIQDEEIRSRASVESDLDLPGENTRRPTTDERPRFFCSCSLTTTTQPTLSNKKDLLRMYAKRGEPEDPSLPFLESLHPNNCTAIDDSRGGDLLQPPHENNRRRHSNEENAFTFGDSLVDIVPSKNILRVCEAYKHCLLTKHKRGLGFGVWGLGFGVWEIGR